MNHKEYYLITKTTLALLPMAHEKYQTKIIDEKGVFYSKKKPLEIVDDSCYDGGAPYAGKRKAIRRYTGISQKVPAPIRTEADIYAIPTHSPEQFECIWFIAHHFVDAYEIHNPSRTIIVLTNDVRIEVTISLYTVFEQLKKTFFVAARFSPSNKFSFWLNSTNTRIIRPTPDFYHFLAEHDSEGQYKKLSAPTIDIEPIGVGDEKDKS
jgi:competence protein ComK